MGEALLSRLVSKGVYAPSDVLVSDPLPQRQDALKQQYGVEATADNAWVMGSAEVVLLAVKPQIFHRVVEGLKVQETSGHPVQQLIISILAGTAIQQLESAFPDQSVVRAMPNTPATVGAGMTAIAPGQHTSSEQVAIARQLFEAVGEVVEVPESMMDAVTGVSGSGPGFLAVVAEAMIDGGVLSGLPRTVATQLALQTLRGTAELLQSGVHPAELKDRVTSPGGTTIAGVAQMESAGVRSAIIQAVRAACERSQSLGQ
ncbi:MAG: pyrroline-5-carboxylate reductase [Merismopedia sp. SIO2A8]|nr:pyrroline-5-carboxylate reductase [Symploca sp. SIO2B6]NET50871.1 pyrroline-5-carboxylate reductase [Merismopedia sp. SIO2A8]